MKRNTLYESLLTFLSGVLFGTLITFAALGTLATAFSLHILPTSNSFYRPIDLSDLFLFSLGISLIFSLLFTIRRLWILAPILLVGLLGYHWHYGDLKECTFDFLYIISRQYDNAYRCGVIFLNETKPVYSNITIVFRSFAFLGSAVITWATCKRQSSYWVIIISLLCLVPCCVVTNTIPEERVLFLWIFSVILFMITNYIRKACVSHSFYAGLIYSVVILPILLLLFALVPKDSYAGKDRADAILDRFDDIFQSSNSSSGRGSGTKIQDSVDLSNLKDRKEWNVPVMYVKVPSSGTYYLRGEVYSTYDGTQWIAEDSLTKLPWSSAVSTTDKITIRTRFEHDYFYIPYEADPEILYEGDMLLLNTEGIKEYSFNRYLSNEDYLGNTVSGEGLLLWTDLPVATEQWASRVAQELKRKAFSDYQDNTHFIIDPDYYVSLVEDYVRSTAVYDLTPTAMDPSYTDFAQWFMEEGESGYCVHFATAATVLLRAGGYPARYVTGYVVEASPGRENTVYQKNSHAWVEYWTPFGGWQILEATPPREESKPSATSSEQMSTPTTTATESEEVPSDLEIPIESTAREDDPLRPQEPPSPDNRLFLRKFLIWISVTGILLLLIFAQGKLRRALWKKKLVTASNKQKTLLLWNRVLKLSKILQMKPDKKLRKIAEKAKFSQHDISSEEIDIFNRSIADCESKIQKLPFIKRFYIRCFLTLI